ncbi:ArsR family transcriptional regulator [Corynebacterium atrinae]
MLAMASETFSASGKMPTWREIEKELGISRRTVAYHLAALRESGMLPE